MNSAGGSPNSTFAIWRELFGPAYRGRLALLCFGVWLHAASSLLAATTLPRAVEEIGGVALIGWAFMLYQVGSIVVGSATGLLFARFGIQKAMVAGATLYAFGCCVGASAWDIKILLAGRALQGMGGGAMLALTFIALQRLFPTKVMPRIMALISTVWSMSVCFGPVIGGSFANSGLWRFAFWAFAIQAVIFIGCAWRVLRAHNELPKEARPFPGVRLMIITVGVTLVALAGVKPHLVWSTLACLSALVVFALFLWVDARKPAVRMFPSTSWDIRRPLGAGFALFLFGFCSTMSFLVYGPLLLEVLHGVSPLKAGYILALESVGWGVAAVACSGASADLERWLIRTGPITITAGVVGFAWFMPNGPVLGIALCALLTGCGFGMMFAFVMRAVVQSAPQSERDVTSSAIPTIQQIGMAIGASIVGIIANGVGLGLDVSAPVARDAASWVFLGFLPALLVVCLAGFQIARSIKEQESETFTP